ncbi:MAG: hypothetical protein COB62_02440 [Piscirickettsiaceae bacterium]|nr:MAG: hypothetical protein COB62_02440 [Piscirickettsiaceae bacterium]
MNKIGRPLEFNPELAVKSAMELFWRNGYEATSLQNLISSMHLSKSSFYQTFHSKHALFQRCIQSYQSMLADSFLQQLNTAPSSKFFITSVFQNIADEAAGSTVPKGCLLMNTANEFSQNDPEISKMVLSSIESLINIFELAVTQSQQQGEIPIDKNPRSTAVYLVSSISGLRNMIKAGAERKTVDDIILLTLTVLE